MKLWVLCPSCKQEIEVTLSINRPVDIEGQLSWQTWGHSCYMDGDISDESFTELVLDQLHTNTVLAERYIAP